MKWTRSIIISMLVLFVSTFSFLYIYADNLIQQQLLSAAHKKINIRMSKKVLFIRDYLTDHENNINALTTLFKLVENLTQSDALSYDKSHILLQDFVSKTNLQNVYLFDKYGSFVTSAADSNEMLSQYLGIRIEDYVSENFLKGGLNRFDIQTAPIFPSLDILFSKASLDENLLDSRRMIFVAPIIVDRGLIGFAALVDSVLDTNFITHANSIFDETGKVLLVDKLGSDAIAILKNPGQSQGVNFVKQPLVNKHDPMVMSLIGDSGFSNNIDFLGEKVLAQWQYIPEIDMGLVVTIDRSEALELQNIFRLFVGGIILVILCTAIFVVWFYYNSIVSSIRRMRLRIFDVVGHVAEESNHKNQIALLSDAVDILESRIQQDDDALSSVKQRLRFFMKELEDQRFAFDQHCMIVVADADGTFTDANNQFSELSGYNRSELIGSSFKRFGGDYQNDRITREIFEAMHRGNTWQGVLNLTKRNGDIYWLESTFVPFINDDGSLRNIVIIHTDVTEQKVAYAEMIHQAQYDTLTGLPNRALLMDRLGQMLRVARRNEHNAAIMFLDLDDFKKINDTLGHEVGDELLLEIGRRLKAIVRDEDTVGRLGGDEFLVLLSEMQYREDIEIVARKIIESVRTPVIVGEVELVVGVSIGIAFYPEDGATDSEILRNADSAMYNAKRMGRNAWSYFTKEMNEEVARRLEIESWLNGSIERGELSVMFQPIVSVKTGKFANVEALVRWTHPTGGVISPDEFIPIAEHSGYIIQIGDFVLDLAMQLARDWKNKYGTELIVAINASPRQFRDVNWQSVIFDKLNAYGLSHRNIEFEITEGVLISGNKNVEKALEYFAAEGISISMDDFGTGYSSLSYLRNYPFDTLKIDRSFVSDIVEDHRDFELVSAAIAMSHSLGLQVVAEGVETLEQYELLYKRNCDFAQGYLFSKPVSYDKILQMGGVLPADSQMRKQRIAMREK